MDLRPGRGLLAGAAHARPARPTGAASTIAITPSATAGMKDSGPCTLAAGGCHGTTSFRAAAKLG